jgi:hypothetical protein
MPSLDEKNSLLSLPYEFLPKLVPTISAAGTVLTKK